MEAPRQLRAELHAVLAKVLAAQGFGLEAHSVTRGSAPGDNYVGEVLRVTATVRSRSPPHQARQLSLIFKCPPASTKWREEFKTIKFTRNETRFYTQILPELDSIRKIKFTIPPFPTPKLYHVSCDTENDVLVLEDLCAVGFKMGDKTKGFDVDHCILVLQELGRLHAMSVAMKVLKPQEFAALKDIPKETLFIEDGPAGQATLGDSACPNALQMLRSRYPTSNYAAIFEKFTSNYFANMSALVSTESDLSVINHGDCWVNNLLFQYDSEGRPAAVRWFDFQLSRYASLALDLSYFLYTCTTQAVRDEHWEELLTTYLAELNETLALLRLPAAQISRAQLDVEMVRFARFGVGMAVIVIPLFTTPAEQQPSLEAGRTAFEKLYSATVDNPLCVERITDIVVDAINREYLT